MQGVAGQLAGMSAVVWEVAMVETPFETTPTVTPFPVIPCACARFARSRATPSL